MSALRRIVVSCVCLTFAVAAGCGGMSSRKEAPLSSQSQPEIACPLYCIDGPASCTFSDGSCEFRCNQCLCEADDGEWSPGTSCPEP